MPMRIAHIDPVARQDARREIHGSESRRYLEAL